MFVFGPVFGPAARVLTSFSGTPTEKVVAALVQSPTVVTVAENNNLKKVLNKTFYKTYNEQAVPWLLLGSLSQTYEVHWFGSAGRASQTGSIGGG